MTPKTALLTTCALGALLASALGYSSDNSSLTRSFNQSLALTNLPIVATVTFTNGGTTALRGFYYAEELPALFTITCLSVTRNGQAVTNYVFEAGQEGDVYPGCTPYRWVLERPPAFTESNAVAPMTTVQIVYSISCSTDGSFNLQEFNWTAYVPANTNSVFGFSETADQYSVSFVTATMPPALDTQSSTNGFRLVLAGVPGENYVIETSTNLRNWIPLATNTSPFSFLDTNTTGFSSKFYRGKLFP
jgi:hypothetical protein